MMKFIRYNTKVVKNSKKGMCGMKLKNVVQTCALAAAVSVGVTAFAPSFAQAEAESETEKGSQKLVQALKALHVDRVDYLYAYIQSVNLTDQEFNKILANSERVLEILGSTEDVTQLTNAQKAEAVRLFLESAQLAHLQVTFVDAKGNPIDAANYKFNSNLKIQLKDLNGKLLATIDPKIDYLTPKGLKDMMKALKTAVQAKKDLNKSGKFVPMPNGTLPNTASQDPTYIALGTLLFALGGLALVPAVRMTRKAEPVKA
ncbi:cell wall anchor protein [Bacillus sp. CGMCC 1.60114]